MKYVKIKFAPKRDIGKAKSVFILLSGENEMLQASPFYLIKDKLYGRTTLLQVDYLFQKIRVCLK